MTRHIPIQTRSERTRTAILEAGRDMIALHGRDAFTTAQVAVQAGFSIGSVYRYFESRVDLLAALYPNRVEGLGDEVSETEIAEVERLRGIIAEAVADAEGALVDAEAGVGSYYDGLMDQAKDTLAILAKAVQS